MPHKHKRSRTEGKDTYELPPTSLAKPLPVVKPRKASTNIAGAPKPLLKRKSAGEDASKDDTPRAFARLMAFHNQGVKPSSGLDDGIVKSKKRKRTTEASEQNQSLASNSTDTIPRIRPGERMSEYSIRVDAALPVSGLINKGGKGVKDLPGVKTPRTKMERKMHRMYKEWREVDAKRKEQAEEERAEIEDEELEDESSSRVRGAVAKGGKRRRKRPGSDDEDPWAAVGRNRDVQSRNGRGASGGLVGLHDVVQAPPQFSKVPKEKFKVMDRAKVDVLDVPASAGSLRRREELGQARRSVVEGYRQMMRERKGVATAT
ncbi:hypothetical protein MMC26_000935 [Xylographa opegraphella]|nr:hypothetical protein [Xylographa opegraphella]